MVIDSNTRHIQKYLNKQGFSLREDGKMGRQTINALLKYYNVSSIKELQTKIGVQNDGTIGDATKSAIYRNLGMKPRVATKKQGSIYRTRQRFLNQNGYKVKEDGSWGPWQQHLYQQAMAKVQARNTRNQELALIQNRKVKYNVNAPYWYLELV